MIGKSGSGTPFDYSIPPRCRKWHGETGYKSSDEDLSRPSWNDPNQVAHEAEHYQEEHELDGRVTAQTPPCDDCVDAPHGLIVPAKSDTVLGGQSNASER